MTPNQKEKELERFRVYREQNRSRILESKRKYREQNREKLRDADQKYREEKRKELAAKSRDYYAENRGKVLEQKCKRRANASVLAAEIGVPVSHILFCAEKISAQKKEYRQQNREQIRERARRYYAKKKYGQTDKGDAQHERNNHPLSMTPNPIEDHTAKAANTATLLFDEWSQIPYGLCLIRMRHERLGGAATLHLHMKMNDGKWYDQPHVPTAYSQQATKDSHREFWAWAESSLPTWNYPELVKTHG